MRFLRVKTAPAQDGLLRLESGILRHPTIIRFERRESDIQHELNARSLTLEQAVAATNGSMGTELKRVSTLMRMKGLKNRFGVELEKAHDLLLP
jgi:hypothetical protein